jgi:hypothetical protein
MNAAEIVVGKMQIYSSPKIFNLPRKSVRQASEAAKLHSDGQVLPLDVAGGDMATQLVGGGLVMGFYLFPLAAQRSHRCAIRI